MLKMFLTLLVLSAPSFAGGKRTPLEQWLAQVPRTSQIVAIGESAHKSSGLLQVQYDMLKKLITERGVRVIVKEAPTLASEKLSNWLESCRTTITPATLEGLYWKTVDDANFFNWLCAHNKARPNRSVSVRGMDIWDRPWLWHDRLKATNEILELGLTEELATLGHNCPGFTARTSAKLNKILRQLQVDRRFPEIPIGVCYDVLHSFEQTLEETLKQRKLTPVQRKELYWGLLAISSAQGWHRSYGVRYISVVDGWNERDMAQARNVTLIRRQEGRKKKVGWIAHTSHTSHGRSPAQWWSLGAVSSGVHFFEKTHKMRVPSYAIVGYDVAGDKGNYLVPTAQNSLERWLFAEGKESAYVPANAGFLQNFETWWIQNENGPDYFPDGVLIKPADHFDGFYYLAKSPKAVDL